MFLLLGKREIGPDRNPGHLQITPGQVCQVPVSLRLQSNPPPTVALLCQAIQDQTGPAHMEGGGAQVPEIKLQIRAKPDQTVVFTGKLQAASQMQGADPKTVRLKSVNSGIDSEQ